MSFDALVGVDSCEAPGTPRVTPGDRAASYLYQKLSQSTPSAGVQMPMNGTPLATELQEAVGTWIDEGAASD